MLFEVNDEDLAKQAKEIADKTTDDPVLRKYIEGLNFRVLKLERTTSTLITNFWLMFFFIFVLPLFFAKGQ